MLVTASDSANTRTSWGTQAIHSASVASLPGCTQQWLTMRDDYRSVMGVYSPVAVAETKKC